MQMAAQGVAGGVGTGLAGQELWGEGLLDQLPEERPCTRALASPLPCLLVPSGPLVPGAPDFFLLQVIVWGQG